MDDLPALLRFRLAMLRLSASALITIERLLEALWPLLLWLGAFFILWLLMIPEIFGRAVEIATSVLFAIGFVFFLTRAIFSFRLPRHHDVTRRIEDDNLLAHRPLSGLNDRLANPDDEKTKNLWMAWQVRLRPSLQSLRWPKSQTVMSRRDPFALRALALIGLIVLIIIAGPAWRQRISHGLLPALPVFAKNNADTITLWITPPAYTSQPQLVLSGAGAKDKTVSIPEGSIVKASLKALIGHPALAFDDHEFPMNTLGDGNFGIEKIAQAGSTLSVRQLWMNRARWPIHYVTDQPPTLTQKGDPQIQAKGAIKIPLSVQDDYGIETVTAHIRLDPASVPPPLGTPVDDVRNIVSPPKTAMDFTPQFDLAWHPWAGMPVIMDIEAKDHKGQVATIHGLKLTLPERQFRHPLAQKLVQMRKRLIWSPESAAKNVAYEIESIMVRPGLYQGDEVVFLSLRSMASHLVYKPGAEEAAKVVAQLWDTALRLEDGNFTMAQRNLRDAQADLQNALRDPKTTPDQIAALMDKMRQAMANYLKETFREMQKQMAQNGADSSMLNAENFMKAINPEALLAMLDKMQAQAMSGDRNAAQQMLTQMQKMMENLDPSSMQTEMPQDMQEMAQQVAELQKLIDAQKALLAETQAQTGSAGQKQDYSAPAPADLQALKQLGIDNMPPPPQQTRQGDNAPKREVDSEELQAEQEKLRQSLIALTQQAADKIGKVQDGMGKAELNMRKSSQALAGGDGKNSVPFQQQAIKDLSDGQKQMSQQLAERMAQMVMFSFGQGPTDPLGRPLREDDNSKVGEGSKVKIPDQAERKKIQDILEQLRKKSGELARPEYELDYYRRLMRQF